MPNAEPSRWPARAPRAERVIAALLASACALAATAHAAAAPRSDERPYSFAVLTGIVGSSIDDARAQRLVSAIGRDRSIAFIVYAGNLKGIDEQCRDSLYDERIALLNASRAPVVFVPGAYDWVTCALPREGGYDPVERLDFLRQNVLSDSMSFGQSQLQLARESEVPRFSPYRENVRWVQGDTVFVGVNAPSPNNHYLTAGGRNGEFEDRVIANAFWIEHAAEYAKRRDAHALVIVFEADPRFDRYEHRERFAWLRFERARPRDGFLELKRSLVEAAAIFHGTILVVHASETALPNGYLIDRPLRNDKGILVGNLTRVAIGPQARLTQWIRIQVDPARKTRFSVSEQTVPKQVPLPPLLPAAPPTAPQMPGMPGMPEVPSWERTPAPGEEGASGAQPGAGSPSGEGDRIPGAAPPSSGAAPSNSNSMQRAP